jgi:fatty acid synthase subunit alpha, fungi type
MPVGAEDMPLGELSATIQATFHGRLGKKSQFLIDRMLSSKMPGSFNIRTAREYLGKKWSLQSGRQDAVLLAATTKQPSTRISSENESKGFLDSVAENYFSTRGLSLPLINTQSSQEAAKSGVGKQEVLDEVQKIRRNHHDQMLRLHAKELEFDLHATDRQLTEQEKLVEDLRSELELWTSEHGDVYSSGIKPMFDPLKTRRYDSSWNWAQQDVFLLFFGILNDTIKIEDQEAQDLALRIINRPDPRVFETISYFFGKLCALNRTSLFVLSFVQALLKDVEFNMKSSSIFKKLPVPTAPQTIVEPSGIITLVEVARPVESQNYQRDWDFRRHSVDGGSKLYCNCGLANSEGEHNHELHCKEPSMKWLPMNPGKLSAVPEIQVKTEFGWERSENITTQYLEALGSIGLKGLSFENSYVLLTGAGEGSLGAKLIEGLLSGAANIIVTTSSYSQETLQKYQELYRKYGAQGSRLVAVPFNQGSQQDVERLVSYIYDPKNGLGWDLDHIIPFAAISENGREIDELDSKSEFAHRLMLTNTLRLLGAVKKAKCARRITSRPAQVILPLSPNHGLLGNDGLYSESKLGLEGMFGKWNSESWSDYLSICGAIIGWTRGTNLMEGSDIISEGIEKLGIRTFSREEMAFRILALMAPDMLQRCQLEPIKVDLSGNMTSTPHLKNQMIRIREEIINVSEERRAIAEEDRIAKNLVSGHNEAEIGASPNLQPRSNIKLPFPKLPDYKMEIEPLSDQLKGLIDLDKVVVIAGFAEVGPYGNARTRWEMEAYGEFSLEGCIEMAWIMNIIKHHSGPTKQGDYCGWVEAETGQPISDVDIKYKYEKRILEHSGIRLIDPSNSDASNGRSREILHEVIVQADLKPFGASRDTAHDFKRAHGDRVHIIYVPESGEYEVCLKRGARLLIPKALKKSPRVVGEVPAGWNAKTYGIDDTIISQVDTVTLFALICTVEALLSAGITDPFEIYQYIHVSDFGNCLGSGVGGIVSTSKIFKDRLLDKEVQSDILQESFINTTGAWVNMLLLSSSGAIKTPVGACATSLESLDSGYDLIIDGKAKMCLVGGFDHTVEEISEEFGNMKATVNVVEQLARGRTPREMSRPAATTRNGFVESHGAGIQILATASVALKMGLPIHGVIALTTTASDKINRSVPAPGKGLLTVVRELPSTYTPPLLDIKYRKRRLELRKSQIIEQRDLGLDQLNKIYGSIDANAKSKVRGEDMERLRNEIEIEYEKEIKKAQSTYGNEFWKDDARISPLRGALAVWGLTIDDLSVASFHGTSTIMSEKNESEVIHTQFEHLHRAKGNPVLGVFQKHLTGHPKGAAGAWMLNGCLQILDTGLVPGNRNVDNVDEALKKFDHIVFPNRSIQTDGVKAFSVASFGFGQKGAQAIGVHPKYLFAALEESAYSAYQQKVNARQKRAYRYFHNALVTNKMFMAKHQSPYSEEEEAAYLMNPAARLPMT